MLLKFSPVFAVGLREFSRLMVMTEEFGGQFLYVFGTVSHSPVITLISIINPICFENYISLMYNIYIQNFNISTWKSGKTRKSHNKMCFPLAFENLRAIF